MYRNPCDHKTCSSAIGETRDVGVRETAERINAAMANMTPNQPAASIGIAGEAFFSAADLQQFSRERRRFEKAQDDARREQMRSSQREQIKRLMEPITIDEERLANFMRKVRQAAEQGERQILILRFPSDMCRDQGR